MCECLFQWVKFTESRFTVWQERLEVYRGTPAGFVVLVIDINAAGTRGFILTGTSCAKHVCNGPVCPFEWNYLPNGASMLHPRDLESCFHHANMSWTLSVIQLLHMGISVVSCRQLEETSITAKHSDRRCQSMIQKHSVHKYKKEKI